jgi:hypothetical protein
LVARLVIMLAVMLMPFGMTPASAAAHHSMPAAMAMQHCPQPAPAQHQSKGAIGACTMACASALPAADPARAEPLRIHEAPVAAIAVAGLDGLHPETATPPPKLA